MFYEEYNEETQQITVKRKGKLSVIVKGLVEGYLVNRICTVIVRTWKRGIGFIDGKLGRIARYFFVNSKQVKKGRILFSTFQDQYTCNAKYIAEELMGREGTHELIFIVNQDVYESKDKYEIPEKIKLVKRDSLESYLMMATAQVWIDNAMNIIWKPIPKKNGQLYLNTWHGSLGIKKLNGSRYWCKIAKMANQKIDYFITNSVFEEGVFKNSFWPDVKQLKYGHPRNDIFFHKEKMQKIKKKVFEYYDIDMDCHTLLYAPTFRDNKSDVSAIYMDYTMVQKALEQRFGGKWKIISRLHFHNNKNLETQGVFKNNPNIIDASAYPDIQELMVAADIGVTDYSSWIFDFMLSGKPAFIYATDIHKYVNSRGFYYSLDQTPFAISDSSKALAENILQFNDAEYQKKKEAFLEEKGCYEDGKASMRTADFIMEYIGDK